MENKVIQRYFKNEEIFKQVVTDFKTLIRIVNNSGGEYSIQLREDYFNIYYKGNSLARVKPFRRGKYQVEIHAQFAKGKVFDDLVKYSYEEPYKGKDEAGKYVRFRVTADKMHQFLQKKHIIGLSRNIEERNYGEEIAYEQVIITDNPPTQTFIIIDRQIADHRMKAQMDLLALVRDSVEHPFRFLIIEMKLGRNPELSEKVGQQLSDYVRHVESYICDYIDCYKENYRQKKQMGLFDGNFPDEIDIEQRVTGLLVVAGYSQLADKALQHLKTKWPDLNVQQLKNIIKPPTALR
ncbi:MAG: hypothetical protein DRI01_05215 [Chloroflexi bacterium]|nr:MAG: hypothetical protein DRI01_05215 [Chloroflexota bacterium]